MVFVGESKVLKSLRTTNLMGLDFYEVRRLIARAFEVWSRHSKLTFAEVDSDKADILIYFYSRNHGDNFAFDGRGVVLAHAFFPNGGKSTEVHFDADELWTLSSDPNAEGTNFFNVAAHEFGHSLGLAHSSVDTALMYPWYKEIEDNGMDFELPDDDKNAIQTLYGYRQDRLWGRLNPTRPRTTSTTTTTQRTQRTWRTQPPTTRATRNPPHVPYDPRFPNGINPNFPPYPKKPKNPIRYYPTPTKKPIYPTKRPSTPERTTSGTKPTVRRGNEHHHHRNHHHNNHHHQGRPVPNTCDTSYDAISVIRNEVFIFKGAYFWRIGDKGLMQGYPAETKIFFKELPDNLTVVDAVYERPDGKIIFFVGKKYYLFSGNRLEWGYPKPLTNLGLPDSLKKIDGAMVWGYNTKTYFFSGNEYWKFDEDIARVEPDYPRDMSMWKGVGQDIDAVFQWKDGKTYFFKGNSYWKFDDLRMRVDHEEPKLSAPFWMGCTETMLGSTNRDRKISDSSKTSTVKSHHVTISLILAIIWTVL